MRWCHRHTFDYASAASWIEPFRWALYAMVLWAGFSAYVVLRLRASRPKEPAMPTMWSPRADAAAAVLCGFAIAGTAAVVAALVLPFVYPEKLGVWHEGLLWSVAALMTWLCFCGARNIVGVGLWTQACLRMRATDWKQEYEKVAACRGTSVKNWSDPKFFVVIPNYKEPLEVLQLALTKLAATPHLCTEQVVVVLAMEEREGLTPGSEAEKKVTQLKTAFAQTFRAIVHTTHPANLPGEVPGKASNERWAIQKIEESFVAGCEAPLLWHGFAEEDAVVAILDSDSFLDPQFLPHVAYAFCTREDRHLLCYTPTMVATSNIWNIPGPARIFNLYTVADEMASTAGRFVRLPYSTYCYSLRALKAIGGGKACDAQEPDVLAEDHHLFLKATARIPGFNTYPVPLPCLNYSVGDAKDTWLENVLDRRDQAVRHMFGINEIMFYAADLAKRNVWTWRQIHLGLRLLHIHFVYSLGGGGWALLGGLLPLGLVLQDYLLRPTGAVLCPVLHTLAARVFANVGLATFTMNAGVLLALSCSIEALQLDANPRVAAEERAPSGLRCRCLGAAVRFAALFRDFAVFGAVAAVTFAAQPTLSALVRIATVGHTIKYVAAARAPPIPIICRRRSRPTPPEEEDAQDEPRLPRRVPDRPPLPDEDLFLDAVKPTKAEVLKDLLHPVSGALPTTARAIVAWLVVFFCALCWWAYWDCLALPNAVSGGYRPPALRSAAARAAAGEVRVLSLNLGLRSKAIHGTEPSWEDLVDDFLAEADGYDVLSLQQVWLVGGQGLKRKLIRTAAVRGFTHWARSACFNGCAVDGMLLLLSRHPLVAIEEVAFKTCRYSDCFTSKGAMFARVLPFGDERCTFEMVNTHLQTWDTRAYSQTDRSGYDFTEENSTMDSPETVRSKQLAQIEAQLWERRADMPGLPTLLAGELNIRAGSDEHAAAPFFQDYVDVVGEGGAGRRDYLLWSGAGRFSSSNTVLGGMTPRQDGVATTLRCPRAEGSVRSPWQKDRGLAAHAALAEEDLSILDDSAKYAQLIASTDLARRLAACSQRRDASVDAEACSAAVAADPTGLLHTVATEAAAEQRAITDAAFEAGPPELREARLQN